MDWLIQGKKSVIVACDVNSLDKLSQLAFATATVPGIGGYKIGLELVMRFGMTQVVKCIRQYSKEPIIYDHQKGATDIPDLGLKFAKAAKEGGVDAVILFPFGGRKTEQEWIKACHSEGLKVLVGGHMTQPEFLEEEGGFIADGGPSAMYHIASENEVRDFVVPGNKTAFVEKYRGLLESWLGIGNFALYAPGFIKQGGNISDTGEVAGERWHAIVGSAIYKAEDIHKAALEVTSQIT